MAYDGFKAMIPENAFDAGEFAIVTYLQSKAWSKPVTSALPPIGLEANRKGLEMAIESSLEQKIIRRRLSVDELFDDTQLPRSDERVVGPGKSERRLRAQGL